MAPTNDQASILTRLGYDPTDLKQGLQQAKEDVAQYKAQAVLLETQLKQAKVQLQTEYTAEFRRQTQQRLSDINDEMSATGRAMSRAAGAQRAALGEQLSGLRSQWEAQRSILSSYDAQIAKVRELAVAQVAMSAKAKESAAAASLFNTVGGAGGVSARTTNAIAQMVDQFRLRVGGTIPGMGFLRGYLPVGQDVESMASKVDAALGGMAVPILGTTAAVAALATGLVLVTHHMMDFAQSIANTSAATGLSYSQVQQFSELSKIMGLDAQQMGMAFARIQSQIGEFLTTGSLTGAGGSQFLLKVLNQLGISLRDTAGNVRPVVDILADFYDALQKIPDQGERTALTLEAFGTRGRIIAQMFAEAENSGESFRQMLEHVNGVVLPDNQINSILREKQAWDELVVSIDGALRKVGAWIAINAFGYGSPSGGGAGHLASNAGSLLASLMGNNRMAVAFSQYNSESERNAMVSNLPLTRPGDVDVSRSIAELQKRRAAAREMLAEYQAGGKTQYELKQKEAELANAAAEGDTKRLKTLMAQIDALKEQVANQKQIVNLTKEAEKALEKAEAKFSAMNGALRQGPGGPFGTVAPDLAAAVNKKISEAIIKSGTPLPMSSFGANGFTGNFGFAPNPLTTNIAEMLAYLAGNATLLPQILAPVIRQTSQMIPGLGADFHQLLGAPSQPAPVGGALPVEGFQQQFTTLQSKYQVNLLSAQQYIDALKQVAEPLKTEIALRSQAVDMTAKQREELQKMLDLLKSINSAEGSASSQTPMGSLLQGFKDIADIVGKFSAGLSKSLSQGQASFEVAQTSLDILKTLPGVKTTRQAIGQGFKDAFSGNGKAIQGVAGLIGAYATGIASIVNGPGGAMGALGGALTGAEMGTALLPGPGTAIGAIVGGIAGIFGSGKSQHNAELQAQKITDAANRVTQALNLNAINLQTAIAELQAQKAQAQQISGKGTENTRNSLVQQLNGQINQLQAQQLQILNTFRANLAALEVPVGAQSLVQQLEQIATALKQAAGAGATASEQIDYLNASMKNLTLSLGDTLNSDESNLLSQMQSAIDIRQQEVNLGVSEATQIASIKGQLGVGRAYTPAEQASLQIKQIELQSNQQMLALKNQQALLDAQINGEAQLFGFSMADLNVADAKQKILAAQLALQQKITAETVAQIQAQQAYYGQLLNGQIPALPSGALPPGFSWPSGAGANYTFGDINITVADSANLTPTQMAALMRQALLQITRQRGVGLQ